MWIWTHSSLNHEPRCSEKIQRLRDFAVGISLGELNLIWHTDSQTHIIVFSTQNTYVLYKWRGIEEQRQWWRGANEFHLNICVIYCIGLIRRIKIFRMHKITESNTISVVAKRCYIRVLVYYIVCGFALCRIINMQSVTVIIICQSFRTGEKEQIFKKTCWTEYAYTTG